MQNLARLTYAALRGNSLGTRITVLALVICIVSIGALTLYARQALREDLQRLLGEQQFSIARLVAADVDQALIERMNGLHAVASLVTPALLHDPARLQRLLEDQRWNALMFSAGVFASDLQGTAIASVPAALGRVGSNFRDREYLIAALDRGETVVSGPVMGKFLHQPVVSIATPVRDARGHVMGALVGVVNLAEHNFLDHIVANHYGRSGGYLIVDARHGKFVAATDKSYILQSLPAPGINTMSDRYRQGYEGYGLTTSSKGELQMTAASQISSSNWYAVVLQPIDVAFTPIRAMESRIVGAALVITVLAGTLLWWTLRRNLEPLASTARDLKALSVADSFPQALPVPAVQEVGYVIAGFNHLLSRLQQREAATYQSEKRFRAMTEGSPQAIAVHRDGVLVYVNPAAVQLFAAGSDRDLLGRHARDFVPAGQLAQRATGAAVASRALPPVREQTLLRADGQPFVAEVHSCAIVFDGLAAVQVTMRDLTRQHQHEAHLRQLSRITEQAPLAITITDLQGNIEYSNPWFSRVTGYSAEELRGQNARLLQSGQTPVSTYRSLWQTLVAGRVWHGEFHNRRKSGELFVESATIAPVHDPSGQVTHYVALKQDITLRKQTEAALHDTLRDKVALLNEVHHRVKNNLQVITSMLRLEAGRSDQSATRSVLRDMQGRIRSMALLHETLCRSDSMASIDLAEYLGQLASQAFRAQTLAAGAVRLELALQPVWVDMDLATPCGLLVNELLTNSLKHGVAADGSGEIRITLQPLATPTPTPTSTPAAGPTPTPGAAETPWLLRVSDTGVGLPPGFDLRHNHSLGLQLVSDLVRQLRGTLEVEPGPGAAFAVRFSIKSQPPA